jgi:tetratricopeptide (TPR) repeat protein
MRAPREALTHYEKALALIERLAKADPTDAGHGHHLSITYFGIGPALADLGQREAALESYRKSVPIT